MNTLLLAGLAINAIVHLRIAVLQIQDGEDQVKAGVAGRTDLVHWGNGGQGIRYLLFRVVASPAITAYHLGKLLLFPRGITSRFAKEQAAKAAAAAYAKAVKAEAEAAALEEQAQRELTKQHEALVLAWAPGAILFAESPAQAEEQLALGWEDAADAFDAVARHVALTAGQPWSPSPSPTRRIKATVAG